MARTEQRQKEIDADLAKMELVSKHLWLQPELSNQEIKQLMEAQTQTIMRILRRG